jgi:hypothetical protein
MRKLHKTNVQGEIKNISSSQVTDPIKASIVKKTVQIKCLVTLKIRKMFLRPFRD